MVIIRGLKALKERYKNPVLTIGNFDGVHLGHQRIFRLVKETAAALDGTAIAITFDPHPVRLLSPESGLRLITPFDEKLRLMGRYGIDVVICISFDRDFANKNPEAFIKDVIVDKLGAQEVIVGHKYAFGKGKKGTTEILRRRGKKYGFKLRVVRNTRALGGIVSSSHIRGLLSRGKVYEASCLLGRPYMIQGRVVKGAGRGARILNTPTANILPLNELIPKDGVYAVRIGLGKKLYDGVSNLGTNPTFGDKNMSYEVHLFGFEKNIIGKELRVYFIERLRDEKTFQDINALHDNINKDIECARDILKRKKYPVVI